MAVISFGIEREWGAARWVFENMIENILRHTPAQHELRQRLEAALKNGSNFLDLSNITPEQRGVLEAALSHAITDIEAKIGYNFVSQDFYESYSNKVRQFEEMLHAVVSN